MRTLFAERRLVSSFRSRSVVFTMRGSVNEKNVFLTKLDLEFGTNGSIGLKTIIPLNGLTTAKGSAELKAVYKSIVEKFDAHLKTVDDYIRLFNETVAWLQAPDRRFNLAATVGFNPLFIHGNLGEKEAKIEVFGRSTRELNLGFEIGTPEQLAQGIQRLDDILDCLVEYRTGFSSIDPVSFIPKH
jgi:hypothetical protein